MLGDNVRPINDEQRTIVSAWDRRNDKEGQGGVRLITGAIQPQRYSVYGYGDGGDTEDNETRESIESDAMVFAICFENDGGDGERQFNSGVVIVFFYLYFL